MGLRKREFGITKTGKHVMIYHLENKNQMELEVTDFGATIVSLKVKDKFGEKQDVVLGYDNLEDYEAASGTFFGATIGRNANRIGNASFVLNGKCFHLEQNEGGNNLHSGSDSYAYRCWKVKKADDSSITFFLQSPDGDQGFPGAADIKVTYSLTDEDAVEIDYDVVTTQDTIINLTNHSYFNLNGHGSGDIFQHEMCVYADSYLELDNQSIPTGNRIALEGTPMDFRKGRKIGQCIQTNGYDHNWCIGGDKSFQKVAWLSSKESGITMEIYTDLPGVQIYTGNFISNEKGKDGAVYHQHQGICFETQYFPDAVNHAEFYVPICRKGEIFRTKTVYKF